MCHAGWRLKCAVVLALSFCAEFLSLAHAQPVCQLSAHCIHPPHARAYPSHTLPALLILQSPLGRTDELRVLWKILYGLDKTCTAISVGRLVQKFIGECKPVVLPQTGDRRGLWYCLRHVTCKAT
jgi:hypothetical protein